MKKSHRLSSLVRLEKAKEREEARKLVEFQKILKDGRKRLTDLEAYLEEYLKKFGVLASRGAEVRKIRSNYTFISQLNTAIVQQQRTVRELETAANEYRQNWLHAKQRMDILNKAISKFHDEELRYEQKKEQLLADEIARHKLWID